MFTVKETFGFDYDKVFEFATSIKENSSRLEYWLFIIKEIQKVSQALNSQPINSYFSSTVNVDPYDMSTNYDKEYDKLKWKKVDEWDRDMLLLNVNSIKNDILRERLQSKINEPDTHFFKILMEEHQIDNDLEKLAEDIRIEINHLKEINSLTSTIQSNVNPTSENENLVLPKIRINSQLVDVVRILEAMKDANIISSKTEVKQITGLFNDPTMNEAKYNTSKGRIDDSKSNSKELKEFIKILSDKSFRGKDKVIEELILHLEKLYSP